MNDYRKIVEHYEGCLDRHGDTFRGVDWTNEEDTFKRHRVMLEAIRETNEKVDLLDFGCGAGHFYEFIRRSGVSNVNYSGLDISEKFVALSRSKFPQITFYQADIIKNSGDIPAFDYITMNGVLTEKRELSFEEMWNYAQNLLVHVYAKCRRGIAFNVMAKAVDWERNDLFHLPMDVLAGFLVKNLSRNFIIRNDYGLYEYTTYIYR